MSEPRRRRLFLRSFLGILASLILAVAGIVVAMESRATRKAILARAGAAVEEASGVRFTAADFDLAWRSSTLELRDVELAVGSGPPFLTVPRVRAVLSPRSLLTSSRVIRRLEIDAPVFDLGAPLPRAQEKVPGAPAPRLQVERLEVRGGSISPPAAAVAADSWLESWRIEGVDLHGSYRPEELSLELAQATLALRRRGAPPLEVSLAGRVRGPPRGALEIDALTARCDGLTLDLSGRGGLDAGAPLELSFDLRAEAAKLVPGHTDGGDLEGTGHLDLRRRSGHARLLARDFPAALLEPWLGRQALERMGAAGSRLDLEADLEVDPGTPDQGQARADVVWRQGDRRLLEARADFQGLSLRGDDAFDLSALRGALHVRGTDLRADLLEPWLGKDAVAGMKVAGSRLDLEAGYSLDPKSSGGARGRATIAWQAEAGRLLRVEARTTGGAPRQDGSFDLDSLSARLELFGRELPPELASPWVGEARLERLGAAGTRLDLEADLTVETRAPAIGGDVHVVWRTAAETLVEATAEASTARNPDVRIEAELLPESPGHRRLRGRLRAPSWADVAAVEIVDGRVELEAPDLEAALRELRERWPRLVPATPIAPPVLGEGAASRLLAGSLTATADLTGRLADPWIEASATWRPGAGRPGDGSLFTVQAEGELVAWRGEAVLGAEDLDLASLSDLFADSAFPAVAGRIGATLELSGSPAAWTGKLRLDGAGVRYGSELREIRDLSVEAETDGSTLRLRRLAADDGQRRLEASGEMALGLPLERATLELELERPFASFDRMRLDAALAAGVIEISVPELVTPGGPGTLHATVPVGALRSLPALAQTLGAGPVQAEAEGEVALRFRFPELDVGALLRGLGVEGVPETLVAAAHGELAVDPNDLSAVRGALEIPLLAAGWGSHRLDLEETLRLSVADRRLVAEPFQLRIDGRPLELGARVDLAAGRSLGDPIAEWIAHVDATASGSVEAELLNPYLGGASASGPLRLELALHGPLGGGDQALFDGLSGRLGIEGPQARIVAISPYFSRLESPEIDLEMAAGEIVVRRARAQLNQGLLELTGYRRRGGAIELFADVEGTRYRLDYGLSTVLSGKLQLSLPGGWPGGAETGRLSGRVIVDRGLLRRDLHLEREVLGRLLVPEEAGAPEPDDPLSRIDLDLDVGTADGVRVTNNLADLRATWSPVTVRGTLAAPRVEGQLDVEPGGFLFVYGQTARLDRATVTLRGFPALPPELELDMTTSLDDPAVAREGAGRPVVDPYSPSPQQSEASRQALVAGGVASHYADQLADRLGSALGGTRIQVAPLLVFGEADPGARLTVSRDLSTQVAFAVSIDLNQEGEKTYILDLHDLRPLPRLGAQLFTNDQRNAGVTLQQTLELGGGRRDEDRPGIRRIRFDVPEGFDRDGLKAATGFVRGDRLPEGADFDVEVDVAEHLRLRGYPAAGVAVELVPVAGGRVDLAVAVDPGPRVRIEFRGETIPRHSRRSIRSLYRADYYEPAALDEMRQEAVRALRNLGHAEPRAEITVVPDGPGDAAAAGRTVLVDIRGGERRPIEAVVFRGVPADAAERLGLGFAGQADRMELAAATTEADRRLAGLLRGMGYAEPRIDSRRLTDAGKSLVVEIEPGSRRRIAEIRFEGVSPEDQEQLRRLLPLAAGDPARSDLVAAGTVLIESELRSRGHVEARARAAVTPLAEDRSDDLALTYRIEPGPGYRVAGVRFEGARVTRSRWAERVTKIEKGAAVAPSELNEARRRLFNAGVFRSVVPDTVLGPDGRAEVVFGVEERPRFQMAYGVRWESSEGAGAVADVLDRNAFGRGVTLGARGFWASDDRRVRLYSALPQVFGTPASLELFVEGREFEEGGELGVLVTSRVETTAQVSMPVTGKTTTRIYYRYRDSHVVEDAPDPVDMRTQSPVLGWQLLHDTRDDKIDTTRGSFASVDLTGTDEFLGNDSRFLRLLGQAHSFRRAGSWGGRPLVWAQSWRLGLAQTFDGQVLARQERFFAGGEFSVRGYENDSLGPREDLPAPAGGEALLVVNQELRFPVWRDALRGVLFFDAGNVWATTGDFGSGLFKAAGFGLRSSSPIGLLRLDVAFALDRRVDDDEYKLYLGFGNAF